MMKQSEILFIGKTIKRIVIGFSLILSPFIFTACSENDAGFDIDGSSNSGSANKTIQVTVVDCNGISDFTTIQSGDTLIKSSTSTTIDLRHLSDNTKKVCVLSGSAYLER